MLNFKLIVVPTDSSVFSLNALKYAVGLAQQSGAQLKIIYVNQPYTRSWAAPRSRSCDERIARF